MNGGYAFTTSDAELSESFIDEQGIPQIADETQIINALRRTMRRERQEERARRLLMIAAGMVVAVFALMVGGVL